MSFLSILHLIGSLAYLFLAIFIFIKNPKSLLNRVCALLILCFSIWGVAPAFAHNPNTSRQLVILSNKIGSVGWIGLGSFFLWFAFIFTKREKVLKSPLFYIFLFLPYLSFLYMQWMDLLIVGYVKQSFGWTSIWASTAWAILFYLYYILFIGSGLFMILNSGRRTENAAHKKQAIIIFYTGLISLVLGSLSNIMIPELDIKGIPGLANLIVAVWAGGLVYAMVRYKFLTITPITAAHKILSTMTDALILMDGEGKIVSVNQATLDLLGYKQSEFFGRPMEIFSDSDFRRVITEKLAKGESVRDVEFLFKSKAGERIPVIVSGSAMKDKGGNTAGIICIARDISALKLSEERERKAVALAAASKFAVEMIDAMDIGVVLLNMERKVTAVNPAVTRIFGYDSKELVGREIGDLVKEILKPEQFDEAMDGLKSVMAGDVLRWVMQKLHLKDGREIMVNTSVSFRKDSEGVPRSIVVTIQDVTEYVRAKEALRESEEALRRSEEKYKTLTNQLPIGIYRTTIEGRILHANPALAAILGYGNVEDLMNISAVDAYEDPQIRDKQLEQWKVDGGIVSNELRFRRMDGSIVWVQDTGRVVVDENGDVLYIDGTVQDITERKRTEAALRESEEKYRTLFEESRDVIFVATADDRFEEINPIGVELFGYSSREDLIGTDIVREICTDLEEGERFHNKMWQDGYVRDYELVARRKNEQEIILLVTASIQKGDQGQILSYRGMMRDVTEQRQLEGQLLQAQKMEAIGRLAGGIAHDFNNLLTSIIGYAEMSQMKLSASNPIYGYIREVLKAADHAIGLIQQLLAFSRRAIIQPKVLNLNHVIENFKGMLQRVLGEDILCEFSGDEDLGSIRADPNQVEQVIMNLAVNARDAMPKGGSLKIETKNVKVDEKELKKYPYMVEGYYVLLRLRDTGYGMDDEVLSHIFEPFFTTKREGEGTGLGLATVYGIMKQNDGFITVWSEVDKGTEFDVYFPRVDEPMKEDIDQEEFYEFPRGNETVLVVEDEEEVRAIAEMILSECGYRVFAAASGDEAMAAWKDHSRKIDMVLADVVMPGMSGAELVEKLLSDRADLKVLFMSGYTDRITSHHGVMDESIAFIQKPFTVVELAKKVREVLDS